MDIVGKTVAHRTFGKGVVKEQHKDLIKVDFGGVERQFQHPHAFERFLTATDEHVQSAILSQIAESRRRRAEQERKEAEREQRRMEDARKKAAAPRSQREPVSKPQPRINQRAAKESHRVHVAFKCTYCDGGKTNERIGFAGVCSDAIMRYNVIDQGRVWCRDRDCPCRKHLNGEIRRNELEWPCNESRMLQDWRAGAGTYHTGVKRGEPIVMKEVGANCLAVLTTRRPDTSEAERFIFAVFLVDEAYEGDHRKEGYVSAHPEFRIELASKEAQGLLYWRYYANSASPSQPRWGTGLFRYLDARVSAQILRDVAETKKGTVDEKLASRFLEHFCNKAGVMLSKLSEPHGALTK